MLRCLSLARLVAPAIALSLLALSPSSASAQDKKGKKDAPLKAIPIAKVERAALVDFEKDILPILERSCTACHSSALDENGLILETPSAILKGGKRGPAAIAGKGAESLMLVLGAHQKEPAMPPLDNDVEAPLLKPEELGLIKLWIDQGATGTVSGKSKIVAWQPLPAGVNPIFAVALSGDGQFVAAGRANQIFIYHVPTGQLVTRLSDSKLAGSDKRGVAHLDLVQSLAFNPAGDLLASGAFREVKLWRRPTNVKKFHLAEASTEGIRAVATSPDGKFLATGGTDGVKLWNLSDGKPARTLAGHAGPVTSLVFSADSAKLVSGSLDKSIRVWNTADGAPAGRIDTPAAVNAVALMSKGAQIVSGGADNLVRVWNTPAGGSAVLADIAGPVSRVASSPDKKWLALAAADGKIALVDVAQKKVVRTLAGHPGGVASLSFNAGSNRLISSGTDGATRIWDPGADQPVLALAGSPATAVALNAAGNQAVTGTAEGRVALWKLDAAAPRALAGDNGSPAVVLATSRDGKLLATAGTADGKPAILVRDVASGNITKTLIGHEGPVTAVAFSADGQKVISGSADKTARVWNLGEGKEIAKFGGHGNTVTAVALASDGNTAVSGSADNSLKSWTVADSKEAKNFAGHGGPIVGVAFTSNNQQVISASADKTVRVWNPADGAQIRSVDVTQPATALALTKDDARVAVGAADKSVRLFQVGDAKPLAVLTGLAEVPLAVSFSPSGARVLSVDAKQATVWDAATGAKLEVLAGPAALASGAFGADEVTCLLAGGDKSLSAVAMRLERLVGDHAKKITGLAFPAEGSSFFTASADGTVRGFAIKDGQQKFNANHGAPIHALAISGDGKLLATAGEDKTVKIWSKDGQPGAKPNLAGFTGPVKSVAFSPDNLRVAGAGPETLVFLVADGLVDQAMSEHAGPVNALAITGEKNDLVVTAGVDKTVRLSTLAAAGRLGGHTGPINALAVFNDNQIVSGSEDGNVRHFNALTPQPVRAMNHGAPVTSVAVRPDGQRFASGSANNTIRLWNAQNGQQVAEMKGDVKAQRVQALAERDAAAGKAKQKTFQDQLAAAEKDIPVRTEAAKKTGEAKIAAEKVFGEKSAAAKTAEEAKAAADKLAEASASTMRQAVAKQKETEDALKKATEEAKSAAKKAAEAKAAADKEKDKKELADAAEAAQKAAAGAEAAQKTATEEKAKADTALADASKAAKEAADKVPATVKPLEDAKKALADAEAAKKKADKDVTEAELQLKKANELAPKIKTDLAAADADVKTLDGTVEVAKKAAAELEKPIRSLAFSADNAQLVSGGDNKVVYTWNATDGAPIDSFTGHAAPVLAVAFGPAGTIVSAGADKSASVWDLSPAWSLERTLGVVDGDYNDPKNFVDRVLALDFSSDGQFLATGGGEPSRSGELKLWKVADGSLVGRFPEFANQKPDKQDAHSDTIFGLQFSADGKTIASCGADKFVKIFNVADGKFIRSFEGHTHHVLGVSWQSNGKVLASSGADNVIKVWNVETGEQQRTIQGFAKQVTSVKFIGDTPELLSACGDKTVRRTRANDGGNVRQFPGGTDFMYSAAATPNGKIIVAGGHDSVLRVWNGDSGATIVNFDPPKP